MTKVSSYRDTLRTLDAWDDYLLAESGLPGPRANLELAEAVAREGSEELFDRYAKLTVDEAPANSPHEFLCFCGVLGLGVSLASGHAAHWSRLRASASDSRWRIREAVATALQLLGDVDMDSLLREMADWAVGSHFEQRAASAALCEPRLLRDPAHVAGVLTVLDHIMSSLIEAPDRRTEGFAALKKALAYCWSVAVAASPEVGQPVMETWLNVADKDAAWIMRENLKKKRLEKASPGWTKSWRERLAGVRPTSQLHLRLADVSEAPAVHAIMLDAFEEYRHAEAPSGALSETVEHVTELLASGKEKGLLCFLDHEPVGSVRFHSEDGMYFGRLAVRTQFQRRGVAKAMLHWLEDYAGGQGYDRIWCRVRSAVARNVQLYESLGYAKSSEYEVVRKDGATVQVAVMAKSLR